MMLALMEEEKKLRKDRLGFLGLQRMGENRKDKISSGGGCGCNATMVMIGDEEKLQRNMRLDFRRLQLLSEDEKITLTREEAENVTLESTSVEGWRSDVDF